MSNIYVSEPPTSGKVVLETTAGDIEIELWSKEAPKACRNFVQLCLEGYYDSTIFHRVVPGWIVQGGDPTGTGEGGESIYGAPFSDEFHSRLRFNRRGLLGMANAGPNDNGSQFFITLAPAPELQRKNTMFGVVVGQSLFTALKLGEGEVDKATERPVHPRTILSARVLDNPFSDIVPRSRPAQSLKSEDARPGSKLTKTKVIKAVKNKKLLSFADDFDDDFDDESRTEDGDKAGLYQGSNGKSKEDARNAKQHHAKRRFNMKSSHDLLDSDPMLSGRTLAPSELPASAPADAKHPQSPTRFTEAFVSENAKVEKIKEKQAAQSPRIGTPAHASDVVSDRIKRVESEINELASREGKRKRGQESDVGASEALDAKPSKSALSEMLAKYRPSKTVPIARRRKDKAHEDKLLERLSSFQSKIRKTKDSANGASVASLHGASAEKDAKCDLHSVSGCKSCQPNEPDEYGELGAPASKASGSIWLSHRLKFSNSKERPSASEYAPRVEDYVVIDPREQEQRFLS